MAFNLAKVGAIINKLGSSPLGWFFTRQNKSRKEVHYRGNPSGGMFGQLVSRDETLRP